MQRLRLLLSLIRTVANPWTYLAHASGLISSEYVTYRLRNGMRQVLRTRSSDRHVFTYVWIERVFDAPHPPWDTCRTIVDVGAHGGFFTSYAAFRAPQARIVAYEPDPSVAALHDRNMRANGLQDRVRLERKGVAGKEGMLRLITAPGREEANSAYRQVENGVPIDVPAVPLEKILSDHAIDTCDLLKLNCEGGEYDFLYSAPPAVLGRIRFMIISYHLFSPDPAHHPTRLAEYLEQQGFVVSRHSPDFLVAQRKTA